jgi:mannan endo-1,4-beta-mannosidase
MCAQALDFVIAEAARHGVRLLLTLVNNLPEYGGKSRYVQWAREAGLDLSPLTDDHFYTNPTIREYYKAHVKVSSGHITKSINQSFNQPNYLPEVLACRLLEESLAA